MKEKVLLIILLLMPVVVVSGCTTGFAIFKPDCPNACCLKDSDYKVKGCEDTTYSCVQNQCVKCGNNQKEAGENCNTCPQDAPCGENQACSSSGECIQLGTDQNCERIGDACNKYQECKNSKCLQKSCPYECCDGSTFKRKSCRSSWDKCDTKENRCVNKAASAAARAGRNVKDTIDDNTDMAREAIRTIRSLW